MHPIERKQHVLVAGGGIGGIAAALGLARKGFAVTVLEQAAALGEIGAGIQLGPNAFHALDYLGVGAAALEGAVYIDKLILMDGVSGEQVCAVPVDAPFRQRFGNPYAVTHRADLHRCLLDACRAMPRVRLLTRRKVVRHERRGPGVHAFTEAGEVFDADALVGADGLNSRVRAQIVGDGPPRISGHVAYRAVLPVERMPEELRWNAAALWGGPKWHLVHYPLRGWKLFNIVCAFHGEAGEQAAGAVGSRDEVDRRLTGISAKPRAILETLTEWRYWVLCDREPVETWSDGPVTLLGDAAHPMLQYFAQGACQALEDAVCLSYLAEAHGGDFAAAFREYQAERVVRTGRVQLSSRLIGDCFYHPGGAARLVRNAVLGAMTVAEMYDGFQWIYGGNGLPARARGA
jgi:2-polyprenyl-6-methoxyphenol hydroxylase-like FAD-dependent oxidoreductase